MSDHEKLLAYVERCLGRTTHDRAYIECAFTPDELRAIHAALTRTP